MESKHDSEGCSKARMAHAEIKGLSGSSPWRSKVRLGLPQEVGRKLPCNGKVTKVQNPVYFLNHLYRVS